jgi:hypothetical protein
MVDVFFISYISREFFLLVFSGEYKNEKLSQLNSL